MRAMAPQCGNLFPALSIPNVTRSTKRGKNGNIVSLPPYPNATDHAPRRQRTGKHSGNTSGNKNGKNGNAARLLTLAHPDTTTTRTPEKFNARPSLPLSATSPATIPAKTATIPATSPAIACAASRITHILRTSHHTQSIENQNTGKNGNENSGNKIGNISGNTIGNRLPTHHRSPCTSTKRKYDEIATQSSTRYPLPLDIASVYNARTTHQRD